MNFNCIFLLAVALFGAFADAFIGSGYGYGGVCSQGYRATCGPASVCDTCQCLKTVVRPVIEQIPYTCNRRVHNAGYGAGGVIGGVGGGLYSGVGMYSGGAGVIGARSGFLGTGFGAGFGHGAMV